MKALAILILYAMAIVVVLLGFLGAMVVIKFVLAKLLITSIHFAIKLILTAVALVCGFLLLEVFIRAFRRFLDRK